MKARSMDLLTLKRFISKQCSAVLCRDVSEIPYFKQTFEFRILALKYTTLHYTNLDPGRSHLLILFCRAEVPVSHLQPTLHY